MSEYGFWLVDALVAHIPPNAWQSHDRQDHVFLPRLSCLRMFKENKASIDEDLDGKHFQNETEMSQTLEPIPLSFRCHGLILFIDENGAQLGLATTNAGFSFFRRVLASSLTDDLLRS